MHLHSSNSQSQLLIVWGTAGCRKGVWEINLFVFVLVSLLANVVSSVVFFQAC
jgi:hypothetical protein